MPTGLIAEPNLMINQAYSSRIHALSHIPATQPDSLIFPFLTLLISPAHHRHLLLTPQFNNLTSHFFHQQPQIGDANDSLTPSPTLALPSTTQNSRPLPVREDCWSEKATYTLVEAWGSYYVELNCDNLRQKDWQDVADAVNALHGHTKKTHRTDVQSKNRIDTIMKKYKIEKNLVNLSNGTLASPWPFFDRMGSLIGSNFSVKKPTPSPKISLKLSPSPPVAFPLPMPYRRIIPPSSTAIVALPQKRPTEAAVSDDNYFRTNYSAMAAAAAAETDEEEGDKSEEEQSEVEPEGMSRLARAIERFGAVYERVEWEKMRQMIELEKQRMQFAKDLEVQRMTMFMDTQVQLEQMKGGKRSSGSSGEAYSPS